MAEIHSTDPPCAVNANPVMRRGEVYSTRALAAMGFSRRTIAAWKTRGLRPLAWGTNREFFLSDDIIDLGRAKQ